MVQFHAGFYYFLSRMVKSKNAQWKEVKLCGNLITDDSVGSLEGLIGLEVLEDYDKSMINKGRVEGVNIAG